MSTRTDLKNPRNYIVRKVGRNKEVLNISLPKAIVKRANIKPQDYMICEYNDEANRISFTKLELKSPTLAKLIKEEEEEENN
jgi:hypothetical protein